MDLGAIDKVNGKWFKRNHKPLRPPRAQEQEQEEVVSFFRPGRGRRMSQAQSEGAMKGSALRVGRIVGVIGFGVSLMAGTAARGQE